jgi:hypothetical protein
MSAEPAGTSDRRVPAGLSVALVALLGGLHLPFPLTYDQAFALVGARALDAGGTLYVDWWDVRQPGLFWFYRAAGRLFGFDELGVHLLELLWMTGTAIVILAIARRIVSRPFLAALAPLVTIGMYYAWASAWELTEPEGLALLPLAICLLVVVQDAQPDARVARRWLGFGLAAAIAALLKLLLVLVPATLAAVAIARLASRGGGIDACVKRRLAPAAAGFALPLCLVLAHFAARGALGELYWTTLVAPVVTANEIPRAAYYRLLTAAGRFVVPWLPAVPLLWLGLRRTPGAQGDPQRSLLLGWISAAAVVVLAQRLHYAAYLFLVFVVPLGLLALRGAEAALDRLALGARAQARVAAWIVLPLLCAAAAPLGPKLLSLYDAGRAPGALGDAYREALWPAYGPALRAAEVVRAAGTRPGAAFVFGNPVIQLRSGRAQAIPLRGTALAFVLRRHWDAYAGLLEQARPPYVFVGRDVEAGIRAHAPGVFALLAARYRPIWDEAPGIWYALVEAPGD